MAGKKLKYSVLRQKVLETFGRADDVTEESETFLHRQAVIKRLRLHLEVQTQLVRSYVQSGTFYSVSGSLMGGTIGLAADPLFDAMQKVTYASVMGQVGDAIKYVEDTRRQSLTPLTEHYVPPMDTMVRSDIATYFDMLKAYKQSRVTFDAARAKVNGMAKKDQSSPAVQEAKLHKEAAQIEFFRQRKEIERRMHEIVYRRDSALVEAVRIWVDAERGSIDRTIGALMDLKSLHKELAQCAEQKRTAIYQLKEENKGIGKMARDRARMHCYDDLVRLLARVDLNVVHAVLQVMNDDQQLEFMQGTLRILDARSLMMPILTAAVVDEVNEAEGASTLFRSNSTRTRLVTSYVKLTAKKTMRSLLTPTIQAVMDSPEGYEVDPERLKRDANGTVTEDIKVNRRKLLATAQTLCDTLFSSAAQWPAPVREITSLIHTEIEKKYSGSGRTVASNFIFLRFVCPALVHPEVHGLMKLALPKAASRALLLITKILQNSVNGSSFKESHMGNFANEMVAANNVKAKRFTDAIIKQPAKGKTQDHTPLSTVRKTREEELPAMHKLMVTKLTNIGKELLNMDQPGIVRMLSSALAKITVQLQQEEQRAKLGETIDSALVPQHS